MEKYKKINLIKGLSVYLSALILFLICVEKNNRNFENIYNNILLVSILVIVYYKSIFKNRILELEMFRYKNKKEYVINDLKEFSKLNLIATITIYMITLFFIILLRGKLNILEGIYYAFNIYIIQEIIYLFNISFEFSKNKSMLQILLIGLVIITYFLGSEEFGILGNINIFSAYCKNTNIIVGIINYIFWAYIGKIFIDKQIKKQV